ncbi:hypothetical protein Aduo_018123 [Ancylostoma duodenale]
MIVPLYIRNNTNEQLERVFALLDSASEQSFISTRLVNRLMLQSSNETTITVTTFGGHAERKKVKRVEAHLYNDSGQCMEIQFLTHEKIMPRLHLDELSSKDKETIEELFPGNSEKLVPNQR